MLPSLRSSSVRLHVTQQGNLLYGRTNICINEKRLANRVIQLCPACRRLITENPYMVILWWRQTERERKHKRKDKSRLRKDKELTKMGGDGIFISTDFLTSCVWIMEVGVQAFFQEPWDLFSAPLLHILHKLLQVCLMEGDKGTGRGGSKGRDSCDWVMSDLCGWGYV